MFTWLLGLSVEVPTTLDPKLIFVASAVSGNFATGAAEGEGSECWPLQQPGKVKGAAQPGCW